MNWNTEIILMAVTWAAVLVTGAMLFRLVNILRERSATAATMLLSDTVQTVMTGLVTVWLRGLLDREPGPSGRIELTEEDVEWIRSTFSQYTNVARSVTDGPMSNSTPKEFVKSAAKAMNWVQTNPDIPSVVAKQSEGIIIRSIAMYPGAKRFLVKEAGTTLSKLSSDGALGTIRKVIREERRNGSKD